MSQDAPSPEPADRRSPGSLRLSDLTAMVIGFALAALFVRAVWHPAQSTPFWVTVVLGLAYLWLGLAMSGPIVLQFNRRLGSGKVRRPKPPGRLIGASPPPGREPLAASDPDAPDPLPYTRAEMAWLAIGAYWITMTLLVVPGRLHDSPLGLMAVLQIVAALALWVVAPRPTAGDGRERAWTHRVAVGLLWTWPLAWAALILLSRTLF